MRRITADFDVNLGKPTQSRDREWHGRSVTASISVVCVAAQIFNGVLCISQASQIVHKKLCHKRLITAKYCVILHPSLIDGASSTEGLARWCNLTSQAESALSALHKLCGVCTFFDGITAPATDVPRNRSHRTKFINLKGHSRQAPL